MYSYNSMFNPVHLFSSDVNEECCNGCGYADSSTPCQTYPANSDTCLQNVTCSGLSGSCPSEQKFVTVRTSCQGSGLCLPVDTQCNNRLAFSSVDSACNYNLLIKGSVSCRIDMAYNQPMPRANAFCCKHL